MRHLIKVIPFLLTALVFSLPATADDSAELSPQEKRAAYAIKTRQAVFTLMGSNMGPLGGMARGNLPFDAAQAGKNATRIAQLADMITDSFKLDTRTHSFNTEALDVIWDEFDRFEEMAMASKTAANDLVAAAASGNEGATKKAIGALGKTCGSCHDAYRVED